MDVYSYSETQGSAKKLIARAVAVVDESEAPPPDLVLSWRCERWGALPDAGGILDQDYATMHRMTVLSNVYNAMSRLRNAKGAQIHNLSQSERRIIKSLMDEGLI